MKLSRSQMFKGLKRWCLGALTLVFVAGTFSVNAQDEAPEEAAIDGGKLFSSKCATCHQPFKDGTGPKLYGARAKWEEKTGSSESIYKWVNNWQEAAASIPYAQEISNWSPTAMNKFPELSGPQIEAIFDWVDAQEEGGSAAGASAVVCQEPLEEEGLSMVWVIAGIIFLVVILAVGGVRRQLKRATGEDDSKEGSSYLDDFKVWAWKNLRYVLIGSVVVVFAVLVVVFQQLYRIGVVEDYQPGQPIEFPHNVHAGINGIDCKYCHNSVTKSKSAGLPTVNVCMNCHKQVTGETDEQMAKISKIYDAAGWDPEKKQYTGKTKPIVWNKVHVLPDHVYFNHSQHVVVGGVDCKQCHGDMTTMCETAKVQPVSELNRIADNIQLTKPTLTMGWCIECHGEKEIAGGPVGTVDGEGYYDEIHKRLLNNDKSLYEGYLEDNKVTVKELGGWECAKCHY